jgi:hypothetical protein
MPVLLNLGCGATLHPDWVNFDVAPALPGVVRMDLRRGLPYPDNSADACYTSHVLEHLDRDQAQRLASEAFRVLKPSGILRVVVPDLEAIARHYLAALEDVLAGRQEREADYDWMMLELLDQSVRDTGGGQMAHFFRQPALRNRDFVISRIGSEGERLLEEASRPLATRLRQRVRDRGVRWFADRLRVGLAATAAWLVGGREAREGLREGAVRRSGEIHKWMYDRYSLTRLLRRAGFSEVTACTAHDSRIAGFERYELDVVDGRVRKPDSLFAEGVKP